MSHQERCDRYRRRHPLRAKANDLFSAAKWRAKRDGLPFTITLKWVQEHILDLECAATKLPLSTGLFQGRTRTNMYTASLDQIRPGEGYTPVNSQIVAWGYNALKGGGTDAAARKFIRDAADNL